MFDSDVGKSARYARVAGGEVASCAFAGALVETGEPTTTGAEAGGISIGFDGGLARVIPTAGGNEVCRPP